MTKVQNTIYVVEDPKGDLLKETVSFNKEECVTKFLQDWLSPIAKHLPQTYIITSLFDMFKREGYKIQEINIPQELNKFED